MTTLAARPLTGIVLVPGTHGWSGPGDRGRYWQPGSPLLRYLEAHGVALVAPERLFAWDTSLGGFWPWRRHVHWAACGEALGTYLEPVEAAPGLRLAPAMRRVVTHSHGLQGALYAAASGRRIDTLLSIAGPIRDDMAEIARRARPYIRRWVHVYGGWQDGWQIAGAFFDGFCDIERRAVYRDEERQVIAEADQQIEISGMAHSSLVEDPAWFHAWEDRGLLTALTGG